MPTIAEAIADLEAANEILVGQRATGGESSFTNLLIAIQRVEDEIRLQGRKEPADGAYAPRTDAFKSGTIAGAYFAAELASVAAEFASVPAVAPAIEAIRRYLR